MADKTTSYRLDSIETKLDKLVEVSQATHDQALKTNGRVNAHDKWLEEHTDSSEKWKDGMANEVKIIGNTIKVWSGGIAVLTLIGGFALTMYVSFLENKISDSIDQKISDRIEISEIEMKKYISGQEFKITK